MIQIGGNHLTIKDVIAVARSGECVELAPEAHQRMVQFRIGPRMPGEGQKSKRFIKWSPTERLSSMLIRLLI